MIRRRSVLCIFVLAIACIVAVTHIARAGTLNFDNVPVDITTSTNEDLVIVPGVGGNIRIGNAVGQNSNATTNDDLYITGVLEVNNKTYTEGGIVSGRDIVSDKDSTDDLGTSTEAWSTLYVDTISTATNQDLTIKASGGDISFDDENLTAAGVLTTTGTIKLSSDTNRLQVGAGEDLEIYHDGADTYISNNTGDLIISSSGGTVDIANEGLTTTDTITCSDLIVDTTTLVVNGTSNRVGIGTANPSAQLEVTSAGTSAFEVDTQVTYVSLSIDNQEVARLER